MAKKISAAAFAEFLKERLAAKDGYIMCATGQNPKKWKADSWWFEGQYSGKQLEKALYWREHAERVWDCNGLSEGYYKDMTGTDINTKCRYNYSEWCDPKGAGEIPVEYRKPGAALFKKSSYIHHVGYLVEPVEAGKPDGDWYIIEAKGVMYGVVRTKLSDGGWTHWGLMTKYFDYDEAAVPADPKLGDRLLKHGDEGKDVLELRAALVRLGYDCGSGDDYDDSLEIAVMTFQTDYGLTADGDYGKNTHAALEAALVEHDKPVERPREVRIEGGDCWIRTVPDKSSKETRIAVAHRGDRLPYGGQTTEDGWHLVEYKNKNAWVSGKYAKLIEG